ncbi:MAG: methyltransferase domain-containing protein [Patescibacteria group bacterium]|nr:methyltransferase domain-containing protein [Patescibacteria group bacterium]MDD5121236.1 methyltransferase domain-containing protein [Patescibacteria group bacterium]MDD5222211.1 methyltransferase domain-containing protein [Patescibacteria group bacterium]MDD5395845.1 methyltransferase domain-containing protein [Patescibacteria group bacterium]
MENLDPTKVPGGNELINAKDFLRKVGIEERMKVGDLGCGARGYFSLQAAKMVGSKGIVYAVDVMKRALDSVIGHARILGIYNIKTVWSNLEQYGATKIPAGSLDVSMLINVLFQTQDDVTVIKEAVRLLKSGGKLVICDWKRTGAPFGPIPEMRVKFDNLTQVILNAGLKLEKEFEAGPYHLAMVFKK